MEFRSRATRSRSGSQLGEKTPTGGDIYARFPGQQRVFLVSSFLDSTFNKNTFALRDKTRHQDRPREGGPHRDSSGRQAAVTLAKTGMDWRIVAPLMARADFAAVEGALERLSSAQMQGIVPADGADLKKHKLDPPVATIHGRRRAAPARRCCSANTENALIYAKDASRPMVFTVAPTLYTDVIRDLGEFRRKDLFDSRSFTATHVEFKRGAETIDAGQDEEQGRLGGMEERAASRFTAMKVEDLLSKVSGLQRRIVRVRRERGAQESGAGRDDPLRREQDGTGHIRQGGRRRRGQPARMNRAPRK